MAARDPISCHVLDTTTGRPARGIIATLTCRSSPNSTHVATTNADGRIISWDPETSSQPSIASLIAIEASKARSAAQEELRSDGNTLLPAGSSVWRITFNTGAYYGAGKTFFPVVELSFVVVEGEHFHVPLLLGPYSYTTYRGS